jgi:hypothetical protein
MAYKVRVILDVDDDVFRDLVVNERINLEELHFTIARSFGFKGQEMASFYRTDSDWNQGEEIPLFDMSENGNAISMRSYITSDILKKKGDRLIYVYNFFVMWTIFVELSEITDQNEEDLPFIALSFGTTPDEAPLKNFTSEDTKDDLDVYEDESDFENLDKLDLDKF